VLKDLVLAIRQLRRQPGYALAVVFTLAFAIGANLTVFSVVNGVLFRALPYRDPVHLMWVASIRTDNPSAPFTLPEYLDYRSRTRTLSGLAAFANWTARLTLDDGTVGLQAMRLSANAFEVLGVTPAAGRMLRETDDSPDAPNVAVLSYRLWQSRFGGASRVVGTTVRLNGEPFVIAGILPRHFPLPLRDVDVIVPLVPDRDPYRYARGSPNFLRVFGRLAGGASREQAQAELTTICRSLKQQYPVEYARKQAVQMLPLSEALVADYRQSMLLLAGAVLVVLAAAMANVISLVLVRMNGRSVEIATRVAVGASWPILLRQLMTESMILGLSASGLAWMLSRWAVSAVVRWAPSAIPRLDEVAVDARMIEVTAVMALVAIALMSLAPLAVVMKARRMDALHFAGRGTVGDRWSGRIRHALVIGEISAALLLLFATTALLRNLFELQQAHLGFTPDTVFQARISIPPTYRSPEDLSRFYERLFERLSASPGVESVGVISVAPLSGILSTVPFRVEGEARAADQPNVNLRVISPGYLAAAGTRLLGGRALTEADRADTPPVGIVSSAFAKRFLNGEGLGRRILINDNSRGPRPVQVVGVVEDVRHASLDTPPTYDLYTPLRQLLPENVAALRNNQFWMVRTSMDPAAFRMPFLTQLRAVDPDAAITSAGRMRDYVEAGLGPRRFNLGLFGAFSVTGVLLAVFGMYCLVAYAVSQRQQEIGLRMAIGATERDILGMMLREAAIRGVLGIGVACGIAAAAHKLLPVPANGAAVTATLLLMLVVMAAWLPARRAARISPTLALRGE